jgi:hypothetical protein
MAFLFGLYEKLTSMFPTALKAAAKRRGARARAPSRKNRRKGQGTQARQRLHHDPE